MGTQNRLDEHDAQHLLSRAALDTHPDSLKSLVGKTRKEAVADLVNQARVPHLSATLPEWIDKPLPPAKELRALFTTKGAVGKLIRERSRGLKFWWMDELLRTRRPLRERMVLFWHGHFTSELRKVRRASWMFWQSQIFRKHGVGRFDVMLRAIIRDPAMLTYLDNTRNVVRKPNENLARELFELFTLGEGVAYGEGDIKEAARALSGWHVKKLSGEFVIRRRKHDHGKKTILGKTGRWDADDLVDIILDRPETAEHIVRKVWASFVQTPPSPVTIKGLAARFRNGWEIGALVSEILVHKTFWAPSERAARIKSPVELIVGTVRTIGLDIDDPRIAAVAAKRLRQDLFDPPNVKGWEGGKAWVDTSSLLRRYEMLRRAASAPSDANRNLEKWLGTSFESESSAIERARQVLLVGPAVKRRHTSLDDILLDPAFQLA